MKELAQKLQSRLELLDKITNESERQWGLMTPQHMLEHLGGIMYSTSKGMEMPEVMPPDMAAKANKRFFGSFLPFDKSVVIPGQEVKLQDLRFADIDEARSRAKAAGRKFIEAAEANPDQLLNHSYFGKMDMTYWMDFHIRHTEHHLMQFGVLQRDEKIRELEKLIFKVNRSIQSDTPAKWGKMNAHQMIEHLGVTFLFSTGKFKMAYKGTPEQAKKMWDGFVASDDPWKEVFPNINIGDPRPKRRETIEESKADMVSAFEKYMVYCMDNPEGVNPHLVMGNLDIDQWRQVHVKHLQHHGRQFGMDL